VIGSVASIAREIVKSVVFTTLKNDYLPKYVGRGKEACG
jgi:hypothetical protein